VATSAGLDLGHLEPGHHRQVGGHDRQHTQGDRNDTIPAPNAAAKVTLSVATTTEPGEPRHPFRARRGNRGAAERVSFPVEQPAADDAGRDAFARYVVPELDVLLRVARTLVSRPADAEDLVQDTLVRAYRSIGTFDGQHPRAWLLTIMRNTEINRHRRRRPELLDDPDTTADTATSDGEGPEQQVISPIFESAIQDALDDLPERFRHVIDLVDIGGLSYAEAATALGLPPGTVMSRLHRARTRIRSQLRAAGLTDPRRPR